MKEVRGYKVDIDRDMLKCLVDSEGLKKVAEFAYEGYPYEVFDYFCGENPDKLKVISMSTMTFDHVDDSGDEVFAYALGSGSDTGDVMSFANHGFSFGRWTPDAEEDVVEAAVEQLCWITNDMLNNQ